MSVGHLYRSFCPNHLRGGAAKAGSFVLDGIFIYTLTFQLCCA